MLEFEQAATHQSVCIKFRSDFIVDQLDSIPQRKPGQDCINRLMLPRTQIAEDSANSAYLAIRTRDTGALTFAEHFVPLTPQTLAQFFVKVGWLFLKVERLFLTEFPYTHTTSELSNISHH